MDSTVAEAVAGYEINCPGCQQPFIAGAVPGADLPDVAGTALDPTLVGIGGWLILPAIGLVGGPILNGLGIVQSLGLLFGRQMSALERELRNLPTVLTTEIALSVGLLFFQLLVAVVFFQKKSAAPKLMIALLAANVLLNVFDVWLCQSLLQRLPPEAVQGLFRSVIGAAIWIPYFLVSVRVHATFVNR